MSVERRYGQWAGDPKGRAEDKTRCVEQVADGWFFRQCTRQRGYGPEGLYCRQHAKRFKGKGE